MKQVFISKGQALVEEIPAPQVEAGAVLVRVHHSCISIGTEMSGIKASGMPLWKRALNQPQKVKKAVQMLATKGLTYTRSQIQEQLSTINPAGYSAAGVVLEVGQGVDDLRPGDRVACAGAQCAHHAEIIRVPRNLTVPIPGNLDFALASTVTLGAIALQGVRRAQPTLGETFVVIGLGILGQLAAQMLRANGCRVIGTDLDRERIRQAQKLGLEMGLHPEDGDDLTQVGRLTDGIGADGVIITAATPSHAVISAAFQICRKKGRVVLVGDVGLHLNRNDFYQKELDFFISTSYGPGRYDRNYEEEGLDYPVGYVRWTENRNMAEYLRMLAEGKVRIEPMIGATYPVDQAPSAYEALKSERARPLMVLLTYPPPQEDSGLLRVIANPQAQPAGEGRISIALIGAGGFAKGMHLPNLKKLADQYHLHAVMSRTGHNAAQTAKQFGASYATTDFQQVVRDPEVQAVIIATRHHLHAAMALEALRAGKHVLLEKPLALTREELEKIQEFFNARSGEQVPVLLTGFNRRFSACARRVQEIVADRRDPMILRYRMNAGYIPLDNWVHGAEGGGRNLGEACHIYDLFTYLSASPVREVQARSIKPAASFYSHRDNFVATMTFADGSVASLTYTALGAADYPKEHLEVFVEGKVLVLDDYRRLTIFGARAKGIELKDIDKGQQEELAAFARAIRHGGDWPIPLWQQVQATEIALAVDESISH
jgi:predicted dehydrogenase/threonine dehydrogenase-like Zn-dependent dehydrogenase